MCKVEMKDLGDIVLKYGELTFDIADRKEVKEREWQNIFWFASWQLPLIVGCARNNPNLTYSEQIDFVLEYPIVKGLLDIRSKIDNIKYKQLVEVIKEFREGGL